MAIPIKWYRDPILWRAHTKNFLWPSQREEPHEPFSTNARAIGMAKNRSDNTLRTPYKKRRGIRVLATRE